LPAAVPESRILDAAVRVIVDAGYERATVAQIAAAADVGEATLYRRFGDKDSLLREALIAEVNRFKTEALGQTGDVVADLERAVRAYEDLMARRAPFILELIRVLPRNPQLAAVARLPTSGIGEVVTMVEHYQTAGVLRGDRPWDATLALLGPVLVAGALKQVNPELPMKIDPSEWVQAFLKGWRK
jgi:AcrR family transcriptional regulator